MIAQPAPSARDREAFTRLARLARDHGLQLDGASVRRTSSRFCLGVEHGDYNGTELFGVGTDRFLWAAWRPRPERRTLRLVSANFADEGVVEVDPAAIPAAGSVATGWARYPLGVAMVLQRAGFALTQGVDIALYGDIPGGGMSRSASLCINLIRILIDSGGHRPDDDPFRIVELAQAVENDYVGSPCGILDQTMILFAKAGHGTHFDPATKRVRHVPLGADPASFRLLALDTGTVRPGLEHSTYAVRRAECARLVQLAQDAGFDLRTLADVRDDATVAALRARFADSHPELLDRLAYIHDAQRRFAHMLDAWQAGDLASVGAVFRADGHGLRDQYRISGAELETMCDLVRTVPGVLGERMLGGGDKGAAGALCTAEAVEAVRAAVATGYPRSHPAVSADHAVHELQVVDGLADFPAAL